MYYLFITYQGSEASFKLKGSGPNLTETHMETISLCGMFLLQVAKKVDMQLGVPVRSSNHTARDAQWDIQAMACHLMEERITIINMDRRSDDFEEPFVKTGAGYIDNFLHKTYMEESEISEENSVYTAETGIEGLSYELHHTN